MPRFGMDVTLAYPPEFMLMPEIVEQAKEQAKIYGSNFEIIDSKDGMTEACKDADVIYAKSWGPLLTTNDKVEGKKLQDMYKNWIMDDAKLKVAKKDAIYMHPLPADRDIEVTSAVLDGPNSVVFDEAENRLHAQKAVMALTMA
jgi:N-acetylornithine carbamoyltransferase